MISQHKLSINLFLFEIVFLPISYLWAGLISHEAIYKVAFMHRFGYLALFLNAFLYIWRTKKINKNVISFVFLICIFTGLIKGSLEGTIFNLTRSGLPIALSNIFALLMPIIMISYGYRFFESYLLNKDLRIMFKRIMKYSFYAGVFVMIFFNIFHALDLYIHSSIGITNFIYSGPFLFTNSSSGNIYLILSFLFSIISRKRSTLFTMFIVLIWLISIVSKKEKVKVFFLTLISSGGFIYFVNRFFKGIFIRVQDMITNVSLGDLDTASSGRYEEALSALNYLFERVDHIIFGAGFGAQYSPYLGLVNFNKGPEFYYYKVHFSHFTPISYMWIGGVLLAVSVYVFLLTLLISLCIKIYRSKIPFEFSFIPAYILSFLILSIFGSALFNVSFLWLWIGAGLRLNKENFITNKEKSLN